MSTELLDIAAAAVEAARAAGAQEAWAGASRSREVQVQVRDGAIETVSEATSRSISLRLWVDGRYGGHSTNDMRPEELARFTRDAVALTRALQPDPFRQIPDPALFAGRPEVELDLVDPGVLALTREDREAMCFGLDAELVGKDKVISVTSGSTDGQSEGASVSSNGFSGTSASTWLWLGTEVTLDDGISRPEGGLWVGGPHRAQGLPPVEVATAAMKRARDRLGSKKGPTMKGLMVVDPSAAAHLVGRLLGPATGGSVQQGRSFWGGKLDQPLVSEKLEITDDPLLPRGLGSRLFDGEGISARKMPLVQGGALRALYIDTYYGRKLGMAPTSGGPSNRVVRPGARDLAAILADLDHGIYVTSWLGGNADTTSGDFSFGMRGHVVEKGKVGAPVGEMNVSGNLLTLFAGLAEVGSDPWPWSSTLVPTLVFDGVDFSGA